MSARDRWESAFQRDVEGTPARSIAIGVMRGLDEQDKAERRAGITQPEPKPRPSWPVRVWRWLHRDHPDSQVW